jgi:hypothetical protein
MGRALVKCVRYGVDFITQAFGLLKRMVMEPSLEKLIAAIVSHVQRNDGYITKTKLLKLLYLFDVEYYRIHRKTFTGLQWMYFHLGPWTDEYDPILRDLVSRNILIPSQSSNSDYETTFYRTPERVEVFKLFPQFGDEKSLRVVLNAWGNKTTAEILDHVYFRTEPMEKGERGKLLDFSVIPAEEPLRYKRSSSGKTPEQIRQLRKRFQQESAARATSKEARSITPPRYDEEFWEAMSKLETMN